MGEELSELYQEVDRQTRELAAQHADRLQCRSGCCCCCVDEITVFEVEAENIRRHYTEFLARHTPYPPGACTFLDDAGACRIYVHRPYVCRTQGLPLRWIDELPDGAPAELRDICPLNENDDPIESLPSASCWTIGPFEGRLAALQSELDGGQLRRVLLRSLFQKK